MTRSMFFPFLALLCVAVENGATTAADKPQKMNVLFVIADDLNCGIEPYGDPHAVTPNLSHLAQQGVTFLNAYCQQTVCNPSRASLLTGRYPNATRVADLRSHFRFALPESVTLPQAFRNEGYHAEGFGKIFHNTGKTADPESWSVAPYLDRGTHSADTVWAQMGPKTFPGITISKAPRIENLPVPDTAYRDGRIAEAAAEQLARLSESDSPFFLAVGFWRPHLPFVAPRKYWELQKQPDPAPLPPVPPHAEIVLPVRNEVKSYTDNTSFVDPSPADPLRLGYRASITFLDAQLGKVLDALEANDLRDSTIIIFTSDHGLHVGERGLVGKATNFELDTRVPLIISDPRKTAGHGSQSKEMVELVDVFPTLLALTDHQVTPSLDGDDLSSSLSASGAAVAAQGHALSFMNRPFYSRDAPTHWGHSLRSADWRYTLWQAPGSGETQLEELYDLRTSRQERENVLAEHPDRAAKMRNALINHPGYWNPGTPTP